MDEDVIHSHLISIIHASQM